MVTEDVLIKTLVSLTKFHHWGNSLQLASLYCRSNEVFVIFDVDDWNGDCLLINALFDFGIQNGSVFAVELDW